MRLTDEENTAESGIDIVASPPGKKLQNVLLLSGGEKALTALALLVGIFEYAPSPFCVLDEVDAPLDETNVGRLAEMIKGMSTETQFLLVTHSKRMMTAADLIYGVPCKSRESPSWSRCGWLERTLPTTAPVNGFRSVAWQRRNDGELPAPKLCIRARL